MSKLLHHDVASLFRRMTPAEFAELRRDIAENGQLETIALHDGRIVDGVHRAQACEELKLTPKTTELPLDWTYERLASYAVSRNAKRRHLSASELAMVGADLAERLSPEAKARRIEGNRRGGQLSPGQWDKSPPIVGETSKQHAGQAAEKAAKIVGVSRGYVEQAMALKQASTRLAEEVRRGVMTLPEATRQAAQKPGAKKGSGGGRAHNEVKQRQGQRCVSAIRRLLDECLAAGWRKTASLLGDAAHALEDEIRG